ncbi:DUF4160 domain-containing protein [Pseudomonas sp. NY15435]|uniref:DUF4160 domain-containing protein n=1 Tax=Pseudomonas sp. NY15435 TaxID=3400358 RepID=UPI003A84442F
MGPDQGGAVEKEAADLQRSLATVDLITRPSRGDRFLELLVLKLKRLEIRMHPDHHARAHVHIDYGKERHAASFAVDTGERLIGKMPSKYDKDIRDWILKNNTELMKLWSALKDGKAHEEILASLKEP